MELKLYKPDETEFAGILLRDISFSDQDMQDSVLTSEIEIPDLISDADWIDCYVTYNGEKYEIIDPPTMFKDNSTIMYKYTLKLEPVKSKLKKWLFLDYVSSGSDSIYTGLASAHFFGNIYEFAGRLAANLNKREAGWTVTVNPAADASRFVEFSFENTYLWDALGNFNELLEERFRIVGKNIYLGHVGEDYDDVTFAYGKDNGLYSITRTKAQEQDYNRIIPVGGDRNLPLNYYRGIMPGLALHTPFLMPKKFRDTSGTTWWYDADGITVGTDAPAKEIYRQYEDIYPTIKGVTFNGNRIDKIAAVGDIGSDEIKEDGTVTDSAFEVETHAMGFNLMSQLASKEEMKIVMTTGACAGCTFKVLKINGSSLNIFDYINNLVIKPNFIVEREDVDTTENMQTVTIADYYAVIASDITIASVLFGETDLVDNHSVTNTLSVLYSIHLNKKDGTESFLLNTGSFSVAPESRVYLKDVALNGMLIPYTEKSLSQGIWSLVFSTNIVFEATYPEPSYFGKARFTGQFSATEPTIKNIPVIKPVNPPTPGTDNDVLLIQKDLDTFGVLMPNSAQGVAVGDEFVIIGIELPESYILAAETLVENRGKEDINKLAFHKYTYSLGLDEKFLADNPSVVPYLKVGNLLHIDDTDEPLRITQYSIKYTGNKLFPEYTISLSDTTKPRMNPIMDMMKRLNTINSRAVSSNQTVNLALRNAASQVKELSLFSHSLSAPPAGGADGDYILNQKEIAQEADMYISGKIKTDGTLIIPKSTPVLEENEWAMFMSNSGFSGELPSGGSANIEVLSDVGDVALSALSANHFLMRNTLNTAWINVVLSKSHISDFTHAHGIADITGLTDALSGKASSSHTHSKTDITDFAHNHDDLYLKLTGGTVNGTISVTKIIPGTIVIPKTAPSLDAGEWGLFMSDAGFSGEAPGGGTTIEILEDVGDVVFTSLVAGQFLRRNAGNNSWVNAYLNKSDISDFSHNHIISDVTGLTDALSGKAATLHSHAWSDISSGIPSTFTPSAHTHSKAEITDFSHNHDSDYLKLTGGTLTGALTATAYTEGSTLLSTKYQYTSKGLFSPNSGVLIFTDIAGSEESGVEICVRGSKWDSTNLLNLDINLYHTNSNISGLKAIGHGSIGTVYAFDYNGYLCVWFAAPATYSNLRISTFGSSSNRQDRTVSVTNSSLPSSGRSKDVTVSPVLIYTSLNSNKSDVAWAASAFTENNVLLSNKYLGISSNAVSATKLLNTRTIWGQNFDGSGNVSGALTGVSDITASGTISMAENTNTRLSIPTSAPSTMIPGKWYMWIG